MMPSPPIGMPMGEPNRGSLYVTTGNIGQLAEHFMHQGFRVTMKPVNGMVELRVGQGQGAVKITAGKMVVVDGDGLADIHVMTHDEWMEAKRAEQAVNPTPVPTPQANPKRKPAAKRKPKAKGSKR